MFRNREIKFLIIISLAVVLAEIIMLGGHGEEMRNLSVIITVFYVLYVIGFTIYRYRKIKKLSDWLTKLQTNDNNNISEYIDRLKELSGHEEYRFSGYMEGELSILQSEVHKITSRMIELNERLLMDKTYLADTLADISHQLKTPMTSMMVMSDLLSDQNLPNDKRQEFTGNIQSQLERMEWLLSTLLKMSKLDAGTLKLNPSDTDIEKIIKRSVSHLLIPMELKNQTLSITCKESESCVKICIDENWTVEAVSNIVKNCMEHTPENGTISIEYGENPLYKFIKIKDTGEGISEEDLPHIFERFYKGKNAGKDSVGIGLAFARQIINMQNGTIEVSSQKSQGSIFCIKFYKSTI